MIVVIDHGGPFLHNLVHALKAADAQVTTIRHEDLTFNEIERLKPSGIVLSSGLVDVTEIRTSIDIVKAWAHRTPILGIGLGMHCIATALGGRLKSLPSPWIGKASIAHHDQQQLFAQIDTPISVTRYDGAVVDDRWIPAAFERCAWTKDGTVLGIRHRDYKTYGIQFHPESIGTQSGDKLLRAFVNLT